MEVATELPASSILRLFVTAVGSSDFCGEAIAGVLAALATFVFCALLLAWTDFSLASEESESELSSESESESDVELESSADVEDPEESESLSLSLMEGRVWLDPAGERGLGVGEVAAPSTSTTTAFWVGASSSESEESESELDESVDTIVSKGMKIEENTHLRIPTWVKQRQFSWLWSALKSGPALFFSPHRRLNLTIRNLNSSLTLPLTWKKAGKALMPEF